MIWLCGWDVFVGWFGLVGYWVGSFGCVAWLSCQDGFLGWGGLVGRLVWLVTLGGKCLFETSLLGACKRFLSVKTRSLCRAGTRQYVTDAWTPQECRARLAS